MNRAQERRKRRIRATEKAESERVEAGKLRTSIERGLEGGEAGAPRLPHEMRVACGGERSQRELVHAASSFGER